MTDAIKYGYRSELARKHGTFWWRLESGEIVEVSSIGSNPSPADGGYLFEDAVCVGVVTEFVRKGEPATDGLEIRLEGIWCGFGSL